MVKLSSVCVYCGSALGQAPAYRAAAARLGALLAARRITLVYGGGGVGLMGVLAQAVLQDGGQVVGVIPRFLLRVEKGVRELTRLEAVDSMHERKERMFALADGFIVLPGGFGTLDETFEIITWKQLGLHDKPIAVIDVDGYWEPLRRLSEHIIAAGFAPERARHLFRLVPDAEAALAALAEAPTPAVPSAAPERL
ncbi:MAG TPA: TIGR00730 family Rossman fold protein [Alphaproteobacteria bacterium]|nr:TIGR00730 family Rossman fold protein [Alphaproteobacteria bacterium]